MAQSDQIWAQYPRQMTFIERLWYTRRTQLASGRQQEKLASDFSTLLATWLALGRPAGHALDVAAKWATSEPVSQFSHPARPEALRIRVSACRFKRLAGVKVADKKASYYLNLEQFSHNWRPKSRQAERDLLACRQIAFDRKQIAKVADNRQASERTTQTASKSSMTQLSGSQSQGKGI